MNLSEKYLSAFSEAMVKPLSWKDFDSRRGSDPELKGIFSDVDFGEWGLSHGGVAVRGEIEIWKAYGRGGVGAPMVYAIIHKGKVVAKSELGDSEKLFKKMVKEYEAYAKKHNLELTISTGVPAPKPIEGTWKKYITDSKLPSVMEAIAIIEEAEKNKHIWNVDFEEVKDALRTFEVSQKAAIAEAIILTQQTPEGAEYTKDIIADTQGFNSPSASALKKLQADKNEAVKFYCAAFLEPFIELKERLKALKPFIEKGRKPTFNPNAKPVYVPPKSSYAAIKLVEDTYKNVMKEWFPEQVKSYMEYIQKKIDWVAENIEVLSKYGNEGIILRDATAEQKKAHKFAGEVLMANTGIRSRYFKSDKLKSSSEIKRLLKEEAEQHTKVIQQAFIAKNLSKVTSIVGEKGNLAECKLLQISSSKGKIESLIRFEFDDNSGFTVKNQVVTVWDARTPFSRYPATFHDVKFVSGKLHKMRSEEQMNKEFAKERFI